MVGEHSGHSVQVFRSHSHAMFSSSYKPSDHWLHRISLKVILNLALIGLVSPVALPQSPPNADPPLPVSAAKEGFSPSQAADLLPRFNSEEASNGGDLSLFGYTNFSEVHKVAVIARDGPVVPLETAIDPKIGRTTFRGELGEMSLDDYLADPRSRAEGFIVIRNGRIVYEQYPGMRPNDYHIWMSSTKTLASLVIRLLAEEGKIDINQPLETYLKWLRGSEWSQVRVIDALDMMTGMNVVESDQTRADPNSIFMRMSFAGSGVPHNGKVERMTDVLQSARRTGPPGQVVDDSSPVTLLLPLLAEAVTNHRWCDLFEERVWAKMTVEGDMLMGVSPEGLALAHDQAITRLRDLGRYGMLYTPSWRKAARERIVSKEYLKELQSGGKAENYMKGATGPRMAKIFGEAPFSNYWQWDAVFGDGDIYTSGFPGQGLYVSPTKDTVVAFFSASYNDLPGYARAIVKSYGNK